LFDNGNLHYNQQLSASMLLPIVAQVAKEGVAVIW
jgi:hypothetical protein